MITTRQHLSSLLRTHRWLPLGITLCCAVFWVAVYVVRLPFQWLAFATILLAVSAYIYGYCVRVLTRVSYPLLGQFQRKQYAEVWDALAGSPWLARVAACGEQEEVNVRSSAEIPIHNILDLAGIGPNDEVLEIGCGVGRVGLELARYCRFWTGADISEKMLEVARSRLADLNNVRLIKLDHIGLEQFAANSFDVVYSTNMFDHLDETDRWLYVKEAFRVLCPRGRLFIDNTDLESDAGWKSFARGAASRGQRPPYMPTPATSSEYLTYAQRAGFEQIEIHKRSPVLILTAVKSYNSGEKSNQW